MSQPLGNSPLLFAKRWRAQGLDAAIAGLDIAALASEYQEVRKSAPNRQSHGKAYFVGHSGSTPGGDASNRREEHLARKLCTPDALWPWFDGGWVRPLDYQVPLKARQGDVGVGKIDLLGVTDGGRLVVVELKVDRTGDSRGDAPPAALMEALRYAAILQANQSTIADEARTKYKLSVSDEIPPAVLLLGTSAWWESWLTLRSAGPWTHGFARLLSEVETRLNVPVRCMAITEGMSAAPIGQRLAAVDLEHARCDVHPGAMRQ